MATVSSRPQKIVLLGDPKFVEVCVHMSGPVYQQHLKLYAQTLRTHCTNWTRCDYYFELPDVRSAGKNWKGLYCEYVRLALSGVFKCDAYKWCWVQTDCVLHDLLVLAEQHIFIGWVDVIRRVHAKGRDFFVSPAMIHFVNAARKKKLSVVDATRLHDDLHADLRRRQKVLVSTLYPWRGWSMKKEQE